MKTIKQILRQPIKTISGILIVALAFAMLITCVGQYTAATLTRKNLDDRYTSIGLLSSEYLQEKINRGVNYLSKLPEKTQDWIERAVRVRTDIIKEQSYTGLVSAYIPELSIDNFSRYPSGYQMNMYNSGDPYRGAMLTVKLTEIGTIGVKDVSYAGVPGGTRNELVHGTTFLCLGTVESVVGLEKGFASPVGKTILLQVKVFDQEEFDALNLQVGETYLVYGEDYFSGNDSLKRNIIYNAKEACKELLGEPEYGFGGLPKYDSMLAQFDCALTLYDYSSKPTYRPVHDGMGDLVGFELVEDKQEVNYWNERKDALSLKWISKEEFIEYYRTPDIALLNGSVEEFLASEEGALWQEALDIMEINNHLFPVLCVDKLGYQAAFAREVARIVEGRDFTEGELNGGEKVCIISQTVAVKNGLKVGDTIELRTNGIDYEYPYLNSDKWMSGSYPQAARYSKALGFTSEMETYTIVGLYRQENAWKDTFDQYGFTPNTIFVPKTSVSAPMDLRDKGLYTTLVLQNGKIEEFKAMMELAGYPDLFICYDQGYSEFVPQLDAYEEVSRKAMYIGLAGFSAVMLLFLIFYPAQEKRTLRLMGSLGASSFVRFRHTFVGTLCILIPGAVLGAVAGTRLWQRIAAELMEWINVEITLDSNMAYVVPRLTALGAGAAAVLTLVISIAMSGGRKLKRRR